MHNIQAEILKVFYINRELVSRQMGWAGSKIYQEIGKDRYERQAFLDAMRVLISQGDIEEYNTYIRKNPSIKPPAELRPRPLFNSQSPEAPLHFYYIITEQGIDKYHAAFPQKVFIIHGHNEAKWRELKDLLSERFNLIPMVLAEQPNQGSTIIEKFEFYASQCSYAFAFFTPDDIVENNGMKYFQARPNVIFELGWFTARLGRKKVCILYQDSANNSIFSDFNGIVQCRFHQQIKECYLDIERELRQADIIR